MKVSSRFYTSLGLLIILNIIIKPIWIFGIDRQVQNTIGTAAYGTYFSLLNFSIVFSFLLDWGLTNYFNRQLAADPGIFLHKTGQVLVIKLLFSLLYAGVVMMVAHLSGVEQWNILWAVIIIQVLTSLFLFFRSIITARQQFSTDAWLSIVDKGLMILLCGGFLYFPAIAGEITIEKFLLAQIVCTGLAILLVLFLLVKRGTAFSRVAGSLWSRQLLQSAIPFGVIVLVMSIHNRLDGFLLERIHPNGAYEAGIYAGAYRLLDAANMVGYLLASFLLPFIAHHRSEEKKINEVVLNSRHILILLCLFAITTVVFHGPWIQEVLYHSSDSKAIIVLQYCLPALLGYSLVQVYGTVMTATGQVVPLCYIVLLSVLINIVLNLLLIPGYGAKGCCLAALASQGFCGITTMLYVQKKSGLLIHHRSGLMYIFIGVILSSFYYWSREMGINRWLLIIGAGFITVTLSILFKLIAISKWLKNWI